MAEIETHWPNGRRPLMVVGLSMPPHVGLHARLDLIDFNEERPTHY
jgi:hypothetical protein